MRDVERVDPSQIYVARKWSGVEWDCRTQGISPSELRRRMRVYSSAEEVDNYFGAHEDQMKSLQMVEEAFDHRAKVLAGETLSRQLLRPASLIVSLGGDNHEQYVSHYVKNQLTMVVNSDFSRSEGGMAYFLPQDMPEMYPKLLSGDFQVQEWPRLKASITRPDGRLFKVPQEAISEIYVGAWASISMSRYSAFGEKHKDSGALLALPAGMAEGSWFHSAGGNRLVDHTGISRSERVADYLAREVWQGRTLQNINTSNELNPENVPVWITYSSYYDGTVSIDPKEKSGRNYRINRGDKVAIEFSDQPLRVIAR